MKSRGCLLYLAHNTHNTQENIMSDVNAVAVISYTLHYDNDTKGTYELPAVDLEKAIVETKQVLIANAIEDGVDGDSDPAALFTITKATWGVPSNWLGI